MFELKEHILIKKRLDVLLGKESRIYKIKASPWASVYRVDTGRNRYILKIGIPQVDKSGVRNEYQTLLFLKRKGIDNIPTVVFFSKIFNRDFLLTKFIEQSGNVDFLKLGELFAKIHSITRKRRNWNYYCFLKEIIDSLRIEIIYLSRMRYPREIIQGIKVSLNGIETVYLSNLNWFKEESAISFLNMDNNDNIVSSKNKIYIFDWHLSRFGDKAWDLARLLAYYKFDRNRFLGAYKKLIKEDIYLSERINIYNLINKLFLVVLYLTNSGTYRMNPMNLIIEEKRQMRPLREILHRRIKIKLREIKNTLDNF